MGILISQKMTAYYERYRAIDVTFTKEIIQVTGMITQQVLLKCGGDFWPCVVYSSSFQGAKIVANIKSGLIQKLQAVNNAASLRLCFRSLETGAPVSFLVAARVIGYTPYGDSTEMSVFTLQYTQRPPDDLIAIIGRLLDANVNSSKRRDDRIIISADVLRKLKLLPRESAVCIEGAARHCIPRELSFSGSKFIMMGGAASPVDQEGTLRVYFDDPRESYLIRGKFVRADRVEGRTDLLTITMAFEENLPMGFKLRINDYLSQVKGDFHGETPAGGHEAE